MTSSTIVSSISTSSQPSAGAGSLSISSGSVGGSLGTGTSLMQVSGVQESYSAQSLSSSIYESGLSGLSQSDQRFGQVALALLSILLGLQDKDDEKKRSASLLAGLMLGGMLRGGGSSSNSGPSRVSQVSYATESYSLTAVQGSAFGQSAGSLTTSTAALGQSINVSA